MRPDTSRWRASPSYDFMDLAGVDDLAWECLRRNRDYQQDYAGLRRDKSLDLPMPEEMERRWGLRFRGPAAPLRLRAARLLERGSEHQRPPSDRRLPGSAG
jgi:hypothetical protein